jgi:zinc protease
MIGFHLRRAAAPALAAATTLLAAVPSSAGAQAAPGISIPMETYALDNGLSVILAPDRQTPVVAVSLWYDVASRNERPGRTGFAHLFEHMMFEGSGNVPKGEHIRLLQQAGATNLNASTSEDRTNYYAVVPPHRLNLALWLESDRMRSLEVTAEQLANQQEIVKEERRLRVDNAPYTASFLRTLFDAAYDPRTCYAYSHDVIGSMDDLNAAELADVQAFFRSYYAPNNATLTLVGDFDPAQAKALIEQYFGGIPSAAEPPPVTCEQAFAHLPVRDTVRDPNATLPALMSAHGIVPAGHPDSYPLSVLSTILAGGESSRLHQRLVSRERAAATVVMDPQLRRGPGVLLTYAIANQGVELARVEALLDEELARVRDEGVTDAELERARNQFRAGFVRGLQTAAGKAEALQRHSLFLGDPRRIETELDRYLAVTRADVQRVAREYLVPDNRAVVLTVPAQNP